MSNTNTQQQYGQQQYDQQQYSNDNNNGSQGQRCGFMSGNGLLGIRSRRQARRSNRRGGRQGRGFGILAGIRDAITNRGDNSEEHREGSSKWVVPVRPSE